MAKRAASATVTTLGHRAHVGVRHRLPPEARVCATLFHAHLRRDADFRLRLLAGLPLSLGLLSLSVLDFLHVAGVAERLDNFMSIGFIHIAAVAVPLTWLDAAFRSESFRAAWIFAATPMDVGRIAFWTANIVALLALPFFVLVGTVLFLVSGGEPLAGVREGLAPRMQTQWNALSHAVNLALVAYVVTIAAAATTPRVPFSTPPTESREISSRNFVRDLAVWSLALLLLPALLSAASSRLWSAVCLAVGLIVVVPASRWMTGRRGRMGVVSYR